jgi:glycosyltransferase involved in cell wall biosynthesis
MTLINRIISRSSLTSMTATRNNSKFAAHFLLIPELLYSPPNDAIIQAYLLKGYTVHVYSPGKLEHHTNYGSRVHTFIANYTWAWLFKNILSLRWLKYEWISGTSEDPLAIVAIISFLYRRKSFGLVDEIKAGSYRGDRSEQWKSICKWGIRRAKFKIVNDQYRIDLLINYASLTSKDTIIVYPGCYKNKPHPDKSQESIKNEWGFSKNAFVLGSSGGFNLTAGAEWLLASIRDIEDIYAVIQPLGASPLSLFLLESLPYSDRIYIQKERLGWHDAWKYSVGFDIGLSIYTNPAPQFQQMGISSNRLCMFIAMGVPVIASKQKSFEFLERYNCGIMVETYQEFKLAIHEIRHHQSIMKDNCKKCFSDYIRIKERFNLLLTSLDRSKRVIK